VAGAKIEVSLDQDRRIVRQRIDGDLLGDDFLRLESETARLVQDLIDPKDVRILVDSRLMGKTDSRARREMLRAVGRPNLQRIAGVGSRPISRVLTRFLIAVTGTNKVRLFDDEKQAIEWLLS